MAEFTRFNKIPRLSRDIIITEKLDGTNASIYIGDDGEFLVGSKTRWITPQTDNYGFARWAYEHKDELLALGPGHHFGEWWGKGIQRGYNQISKIFSLFNTTRWGKAENLPDCCEVVPVLYEGPFENRGLMTGVNTTMQHLIDVGSAAAPGYMNPEGIVIYHPQSGYSFKKTFEGDEKGKGV